MKTKQITGTMVLMIFLLSITAFGDLEVPEVPEELTEEEKVQKCATLESNGQQSSSDAQELKCVFKPKEKPRSGGGGGFSIAKGKTLFGLTSGQDGAGLGIVLGNVFPTRLYNLNLGKDIQSIKIQSDVTQRGIGMKSKAIHIKRNTLGINNAKILFAYEFLSNLDKDHTTYTMVIKTISKDKVKFYVGGKEVQSKQLKKNSRVFNYYEISFKGKGTIEVVKA